MLDRLISCVSTIILFACCTAPKQEGDQGTRKAQHGYLYGENGCFQGMTLIHFDSLGKSVCLPVGGQWRTDIREGYYGSGLNISIFSPPNSSPLAYGSWNKKGDNDDVYYNMLGERHTDPESDVALVIDIHHDKYPDPFSWDEMRDKLIVSRNSMHKILQASPDTLDDIELFIREGLMVGEPPHIGGAWGKSTRNHVHWVYELWVRRLEHSGQIRAGITANSEHEDMNVQIVAQWIRETLPNDLDEVRSDSLFVIFNEVVESFKWAE